MRTFKNHYTMRFSLSKIFFSGVIVCTITNNTFAQNYKLIDSLKHAIAKTENDTAVITTYQELFWEYYGVYNDTALYYAKKAIKYADARDFTWGLVDGYRLTGMAYSQLNNYPEALKYQQKALEQCEKVNDMFRKANILNNLANIYYELKEYKTALSYQERSLDICRKLDIKNGVSSNLGNMGNIYKKLGQRESALKYYKKSMVIDKEINNPRGYANSLKNIGDIYVDLNKPEMALQYFNESLHVRDSMGYTNDIASSYISIANVELNRGSVEKALDLYERALSLAEEAGSLDQQESCYDGMYQCYKKLGKVNEALRAYEKRDMFRDSILNTTRVEELNQLKTKFLIEQKEAEQKLELEKINLANNAEREKNELARKQQSIVLYASIAGLILTGIFLYFIFKRYRQSLRQQGIIAAQKKLVEVKNKEITDSINYAKRIQEAMLVSEKDFSNHFKESFVLFQPKDIVSGDFYWINKLSDGSIVVALGDCTGHGVPGGFMSVLGINLLNEIVNERAVYEPGEILDMLRARIIVALKQDGLEGNSRDGMDVTVCRLYPTNGTMTYALANRSMYIYVNNELKRLSGNRMPVGYYESDEKFTQEKVDLGKNGVLFLFTDGFVDQNGGEVGRKFMYSNFENAIRKGFENGKALQKEYYAKLFTDWKKDHEQVDDVCVIGIKI